MRISRIFWFGAEDGGQRAEDGGQRADDGWLRTEGRLGMGEDSGGVEVDCSGVWSADYAD